MIAVRKPRPRQVAPSAAATLFQKPVTAWYAEWKARKAPPAPAQTPARPAAPPQS